MTESVKATQIAPEEITKRYHESISSLALCQRDPSFI